MKQVNNFRIFESKETRAKAICYYHNAQLLGAELIKHKTIYPNQFTRDENEIKFHIDKNELSAENHRIFIPSQLLNS